VDGETNRRLIGARADTEEYFYEPAISPDGSTLAYSRRGELRRNPQIWVVGLD
jgi:Tol biopolymer transport system component